MGNSKSNEFKSEFDKNYVKEKNDKSPALGAVVVFKHKYFKDADKIFE